MSEVEMLPSHVSRLGAKGRLSAMKKIIDLGLALSTNLDLEDLINSIIREATSIFFADGASIILLDEEKDIMYFKYVVNVAERDVLKEVVLQRGEGIAGYVAEKGESLIIKNVQSDPRFSKRADVATGIITRNMMAVPLRVANRVIGTMEVVNKKRGIFTNKELAECQMLASFASVAIDNARLHGEVKKSLLKITKMEESKHELITLLSHELRTPITVILTSSSLLANHLGEMQSEMIAETAEMIASRSLRLASLLDDLFVINDIDEIRENLIFGEISIREVIDVLNTKFRKSLKKHTLKVMYPSGGDLPRFNADRLKLQHCIQHLIENAIKFSPGGGEIKIKIYIDEENPAYLNLEVQDPGIGIASEHIDKIFDKFYQVDSSSTRKFGGLGLGLYICKRVAEAHGGKITCISKKGEGSSFILQWPLRKDKQVSPG